LIGLASTSMSELDESALRLTREIRELDRSSRNLKNFVDELEEVNSHIETSGVAAEKAGQRIREAYEKVGEDIISSESIRGKTNKELYESSSAITREMRAQYEIARDLAKLERESLRSEKLGVSGDKLAKQVDNLIKTSTQAVTLGPQYGAIPWLAPRVAKDSLSPEEIKKIRK